MPTDLCRAAALLLALVVALPGAARAQQGPPSGAGPGTGAGQGQGAGPGRGGQGAEWRERIERRVRLARSLGLAETLDLDEAGAARMNAIMAPFDARRKAVLDGIRGDLKTLRQAARGGATVSADAVNGAVQRVFDARQASLAIDREMFAAMSQGLPPEKVARLALFFARFRARFGMEMPDVPGGGPPGARPQ